LGKPAAVNYFPSRRRGFVNGDEGGGGLRLGLGELVLGLEQDAFGIEDGKEVGCAVIVPIA